MPEANKKIDAPQPAPYDQPKYHVDSFSSSNSLMKYSGKMVRERTKHKTIFQNNKFKLVHFIKDYLLLKIQKLVELIEKNGKFDKFMTNYCQGASYIALIKAK